VDERIGGGVSALHQTRQDKRHFERRRGSVQGAAGQNSGVDQCVGENTYLSKIAKILLYSF
jgi:hypothetical protein